jgi:hypothetical protein
MTSEFTFDGEIADSEEFESALGQLLLAALQNDIDPQGSWVYRTDGTGQDLEVMVYELTGRTGADETSE